jgi:predicted ATP-grasp superfamily ATP-dependent carboligase
MIIKFDHNPLHHGTLGAIRSLGRAGVPVHLVQESRGLPTGRSRYVRSEHAWPATLAGAGDAVDMLRDLASGIAGRPALLPVDDAGAIFVGEHADELAASYDFPRQPPDLARLLIDKHSLAGICAMAGAAHPRTIRPASWPELIAAEPPGGRWPVVLKRVAPWAEPSVPALPSTVLVHGRPLLEQLAALATAEDPGLLLQEYLPPSPAGDWFFHGYYDAAGTARFSGTGVKRRSWPAYTGLTVLGQSADNRKVHAEVDALLRAVGYVGIVDVDLRLDPRTGRHHVLDVNPRIGAQHRLFQSTTGLDVVRTWHLDLTGRSVPAASALEGRSFLAENFEPAAARRYHRDGRLDAGAWWRSVRSVDELAWFAGDDPRPFAAMVVRSAGEGFRHRYPALRRRGGGGSSLAARVTAGVQQPHRPRSPDRSR